jgi:hypothetical protein
LINKKYDGLNKSKDKSDQHTSTYSKDSVKKDVSKGNLKSTDRDKNLIKYTQENIKKS